MPWLKFADWRKNRKVLQSFMAILIHVLENMMIVKDAVKMFVVFLTFQLFFCIFVTIWKKTFINKVSFKIVKICTSGLCQIHKCVIVETIGLPVFKFYLLCSVYQQNKAIIISINSNASFVHPYSNYILYFLIHVHVVMLIWYFQVISNWKKYDFFV